MTISTGKKLVPLVLLGMTCLSISIRAEDQPLRRAVVTSDKPLATYNVVGDPKRVTTALGESPEVTLEAPSQGSHEATYTYIDAAIPDEEATVITEDSESETAVAPTQFSPSRICVDKGAVEGECIFRGAYVCPGGKENPCSVPKTLTNQHVSMPYVKTSKTAEGCLASKLFGKYFFGIYEKKESCTPQ